MTTFKSKIKLIESEFNDIYRITTENGLVLDIPENKKPIIGSSIEYNINMGINNPEYTMMNGDIFSITDKGILVSFGGLLGSIPLDNTTKKNIQNAISLSYKLY